MSLLDPAAAVAVGICLTARLITEPGRLPVTTRHPAVGCGWCDWPLGELTALLAGFDPDGHDARVFAGLRRDHQAAMVQAAQAIPDPPPAAADEPSWFDLPEGAEA